MPESETGNPRYVTETGFVAEPGVVVNQQFELIEYVGKGATARVWRARHLLGRFDVALKLLNATKRDFDLGREEFHQLCNLYHPNIVRTFEMQVIEGHDQAFMTMELINGRTFDQLIHGRGRAEPADLLLWLGQLVNVLQYLHSLRIIHKDIKPANVVIDDSLLDARAVLIDFNISHLRGPDFGTLAYRCPQVKEQGEWQPYSDVWALALTFYEVLIGREIFMESTNFEADLSVDVCPTAFPKCVFRALQEILHGKGKDGHSDDDYRGLFELGSEAPTLVELPDPVATQFGVNSKNQRFVVEAMLNFDPEQPRSKDVILRRALHGAGRPASADSMRSLRAVFSQLKSKDVLEYTGKGNKKAVLAREFRAAVDRAIEP